jgi:predicted TIM-barrel fold metal-dependent hydrolase
VKTRYIFIIAIVAVLAIVIVAVSFFHERLRRNRESQLAARYLSAFRSLDPIDAHTHVFRASPDFSAMLARLDVRVLDILYVDDTDSYLRTLDTERNDALSFINSASGRVRLCTTFDPFAVKDAASAKQAVAALNQDFARGAVATKMWKNVGMEIVDQSGKYVLPDDPRFEEIYRDLAAQNKTLIIHSGDPDEAWGVQSPWGFVSKYYDSNPQWNMALKPAAPKRRDILDAVDRVLVRHSDLRVIGAHFGSLEDHLDELAPRLERHPNLAVDTAARVRRLVFQPNDKVRAFILKYQDRILYGTDLHVFPVKPGESTPASWEKQYALDWRYFATGDTFDYQGHKTQGLQLPREVLKKIYHDNAVRWIPGFEDRTTP